MTRETVLNLIYCFEFPVLMLIFGILFSCGLPKKRNAVFGIRTRRSTRSAETWRYAHDLCGKLCLEIGSIEPRDKINTVFAVLQPVPVACNIIADRCHGTESGHYNSSAHVFTPRGIADAANESCSIGMRDAE